jgi:hypothetical protein
MISLKFHVDVDETYDKIHDMFKNTSVNIKYMRSFVPPHRVVYTVGPFTADGATRMIDSFRDIGAKFTVTEHYSDDGL